MHNVIHSFCGYYENALKTKGLERNYPLLHYGNSIL